MATISTGASPFDGLDPSGLSDWKRSDETRALIAYLKASKQEVMEQWMGVDDANERTHFHAKGLILGYNNVLGELEKIL
jgi:hypothetical protein